MLQEFISDESGSVAIEYATLAAALASVISLYFANHAESTANVYSLLTSLISKISRMTPA